MPDTVLDYKNTGGSSSKKKNPKYLTMWGEVKKREDKQ